MSSKISTYKHSILVCKRCNICAPFDSEECQVCGVYDDYIKITKELDALIGTHDWFLTNNNPIEFSSHINHHGIYLGATTILYRCIVYELSDPNVFHKLMKATCT